MDVSSAFRKLARFLDECEEERVSSVELIKDTPESDGALTAEIEVSISACPSKEAEGRAAISPCAMSVDGDGRLRFEVESSQAIVPTNRDVSVEPTDASFGSDGTITLTLSASVPTGDVVTSKKSNENPQETHSHNESNERSESVDSHQNRDLPPFRDPELLAEVYESCDTFTEMPDELGMDVTAETVRRYMIDYGIHEPNSYNTATTDDSDDTLPEPDTDADVDSKPDTTTETDQDTPAPATASDEGDLQTPVVVADGIGLPDDVTVETIIETVRESNTIYEVKRDIGIERENTLDMLRELNLLDLVVGRLATETEREISREEVIERLRHSAV
ncbi:hypothetical protein [Halocatena marina]|nr:hypothetical protein [Halocatena marina]